MTLPEVGDRTKIWRVMRHDHHEIDPLGACLRYPPRGIKTRAIGCRGPPGAVRRRLGSRAPGSVGDRRKLYKRAWSAALRSAPDGGPAALCRNFTDPDSRVLLTKDDFIQGYNAQAASSPRAAIERSPGVALVSYFAFPRRSRTGDQSCPRTTLPHSRSAGVVCPFHQLDHGSRQGKGRLESGPGRDQRIGL